jgi:hypothetical protein
MVASLASTVIALLDGALRAVPPCAPVRVTSLHADVPVDSVFAPSAQGDDPDIAIAPPSWRWHTDFDRPPGRLRFTVDVSAGGGRDER